MRRRIERPRCSAEPERAFVSSSRSKIRLQIFTSLSWISLPEAESTKKPSASEGSLPVPAMSMARYWVRIPSGERAAISALTLKVLLSTFCPFFESNSPSVRMMSHFCLSAFLLLR